MISQEQVRIVRQALLLREKNQYTQTPLRLLVDKGYSDCSSFVWWIYLFTLKIDIGMDTPEQIMSLKGLDVDFGENETPPRAAWPPATCCFSGEGTLPALLASAMWKCISAAEN